MHHLILNITFRCYSMLQNTARWGGGGRRRALMYYSYQITFVSKWFRKLISIQFTEIKINYTALHYLLLTINWMT